MSKNKLRKKRKYTQISYERDFVHNSSIGKFLCDWEKSAKEVISVTHQFLIRSETQRVREFKNLHSSIHTFFQNK